MGVMMQGFYWNCPREEGREFRWWNHVRSKVPELSAAGFTSLWLPPLHKAANLDGPSMGYDPYDYYDLGEFDNSGHEQLLLTPFTPAENWPNPSPSYLFLQR